MEDIVKKANSILIISNYQFNLDAYLASSALFSLLKNRLQKNVVWLKKFPLLPEYNNYFDTKQINFIQKIPERKFVISFEKSDGDIQEVKWKETKEKVTFVVSPKQSSFNLKNVSVEAEGLIYDLVIVIGFQSLEKIKSYWPDLPILEKSKIVNLDNHPNNNSFGGVNFINPNSSSICQILYTFIKDQNIEIDTIVSELLIYGIYRQTNSLRLGLHNPEILEIVNSLAVKTANYEKCIEKLYKFSTPSVFHLLSKVVSESNIEQDKIYWTKLSKERLREIKLSSFEVTDPMLNLLWKVKNSEVAFILVENDFNEVFGSIVSFNNILDLFEIASFGENFGNKRLVHFYCKNKSIDSIEDEILQKIRLKLGIKQVESVNTVSQNQQTARIVSGTQNSQQSPLPKAQNLPKSYNNNGQPQQVLASTAYIPFPNSNG